MKLLKVNKLDLLNERRGEYPELRDFFEENSLPTDILDQLIRNKRYKNSLPTFEKLAWKLNRADLFKKRSGRNEGRKTIRITR